MFKLQNYPYIFMEFYCFFALFMFVFFSNRDSL